jgi:predicted enzyme involved in methoxymalonyl-ACP biosynthesis
MTNYLDVLRVANDYNNDQKSKMFVLSNCTTNKHTNVLKWFFSNSGLSISVKGGSFDSLLSDSFDLVGSTAQVLIHYDILSYFHGRAINYMTCEDKVIEEIYDNIINELDIVLNNLSHSRDIFFVPFHVFGLSRIHRSSLDLVSSLNEFVNKCCESRPNLMVLNPVMDKEDWLVKDFIRSKAPHSIAFIRRICSEVNVKNLKNEGRVKKVIVFDCDNTLWKGVIGESMDGSHVKFAHEDSIGFFYHNIHLLINSLGRYGILVGLITKNNLSDLQLFFQKNNLVLLHLPII